MPAITTRMMNLMMKPDYKFDESITIVRMDLRIMSIMNLMSMMIMVKSFINSMMIYTKRFCLLCLLRALEGSITEDYD